MVQLKEHGIWSHADLNNNQSSVSYKPVILKNYVTSLNLSFTITVKSWWIFNNVYH